MINDPFPGRIRLREKRDCWQILNQISAKSSNC